MHVCYMCAGGEQSHHVVLVLKELTLQLTVSQVRCHGERIRLFCRRSRLCFNWIRSHLVRELRGELIH